MKNSINNNLNPQRMKQSLTILAVLILTASCKKGSQDINKQPIPETHGDSVIFKQTPHPQKITEDPNDNYLFGDSVWVPSACRLVQIGLDVLNKGGYTKKCALRVNNVLIETKGIPKYDTVLNTGDSVFIFQDTVALVKGWNFIKFTGTVRSPTTTFLSVHKEHLQLLDADSFPVIGLPVQVKREWQ
jgi:hypothetical protein